ncbi:MAG: ECF transporter S component [bacterium]|nr:ECF transporter S component [bacterium]
MRNKLNPTKKMVLTATFIALGLVLPFLTMQIPSIGNMLCPMHIPVLLCGFLCGGPYGLIAGLCLPVLRSLLFGAPVLMPTALAMSFELAAYGLVSGVLYDLLKGVKLRAYITLIGAMVIGRIIWGIAAFCIYHAIGNVFTWKLFATQAFLRAIPGIILQLVFIPLIVIQLEKVFAGEFGYERR